MKMMRVYKNLLTAAMVVALGFGMGSCADNIDNSTTPSDNPQEQQAAEAKAAKAAKYWAIVSHLVDVDDYTDDYEDKTFEPVYGVSQGDDGTRYVYTNTPAAAAERFADLVDVKEGIDENTATYTYEDADVGRLVYTKGSGRVLATVDVDIKQIPGLKKIVYVPGAYANGTFTGRAYYRFGDVVSRQVEGYDGPVTEYWICVRPSFGREGKGDSHWVCLNVLPKKNIELYHSNTNGRDYYLPKGLGTNEIHMQNLAEMLYAIYNPDQWQENVSDVALTELKMFHDFDRNNYRLHNKYFWRKVQRLWREKQILQKAFNFSDSEDYFKQSIFKADKGLHLLYKGYSWYQTFSWNCSLYEATFKNDANISQNNMHQASTRERTQNMKEIDLDCRKMGMDNYTDYAGFFNEGGVYRWTVRHATGKELDANGRYDVKSAIDGVEEVYRYYRDADPTIDLTGGPEETAAPQPVDKADVNVGHILAESGRFYRNCGDATDNGDKPVAMVVYLGGNKRVEKDQEWNGLAIALSDVTKDGKDSYAFSSEADAEKLCVTNAADNDHIAGRLDGWKMTDKLTSEHNHSHPAAAAVYELELPDINDCSDWFIPSAGQWDLAMQGMGFGTLTKTDEILWGEYLWKYPQQGRWLFEDAGAAAAALKETIYMTTTARTRRQYNATSLDKVDDAILGFHFRNDYSNISYDKIPKATEIAVRPFIAFEYGDGGSVNPEEPWAPLAEPKVKSWIGEDGNFYNTVNDVFSATNYLPVAYVAYVGQKYSINVGLESYRGLAIGTSKQEFNGLIWDDRNVKVDEYFTRLSADVRKSKGFSEWFVPSKDQWKMMLEQGFDCQFDGETVPENVKGRKQAAMFSFFENNGMRFSALTGPYWTSTFDTSKTAYYLDLIEGHTVKFVEVERSVTEVDGKKMLLRPIIAFR